MQVGKDGLYDDHQALKECRNTEKELLQQLKDKEEHLSKLLQQNNRVERDVQRFQERQKTLEKIEIMERKKVWVVSQWLNTSFCLLSKWKGLS